ncbi:hypothetical protein A9G48_00730 [Gilliamella sp. wkB18]|jgi:hypothetical protein|uniref:hypothetical protein n=1 Tax=unclassified Gilliamella TaxID=2685620 RepID=UPI0004DD433A|nr:hypothetical protein [Gilliamella apicola]KFA58436.1 hypothetical protein GAPWKB11_1559 [Gilliamella apicola]OCG55290.1 hypothetical protein A9G36_05845 [Gilliamella apicola]OCG65155.1 hypothetical protein A9G48_00730 [Gilliamella apicola]
MKNLLLKIENIKESILDNDIKISENQKCVINKYLDNVKNNILSDQYIDLPAGDKIQYFIIDSWDYTNSLTNELLYIIQYYKKLIKNHEKLK